jgi:hypothetical protein
MIPGLPIQVLLFGHVAVSLLGIAAGLVAMLALAAGNWRPGWQAAFLITTALTSITGFLFPFSGITPAFGFGVVSMVLLAIATAALSRRDGHRGAQLIYATSATFALYLNLFVLVVQSFQKIPQLQTLAPTQSEPPFLVAQLAILVGSVALGWFAVTTKREMRQG